MNALELLLQAGSRTVTRYLRLAAGKSKQECRVLEMRLLRPPPLPFSTPIASPSVSTFAVSNPAERIASATFSPHAFSCPLRLGTLMNSWRTLMASSL